MEETQKRSGPKRKYPDAVYPLAYDLYTKQNKPAREVADIINAKELCDRIDGTLIPFLAAIGRKDAEKVNP